MLGCKYGFDENKHQREQELIDTCWDVNLFRIRTGQDYNEELIDTCWDVNRDG